MSRAADRAALAQRLAALSPDRRTALLRLLHPAEPVVPAEDEARSLLSFGQQRIWFMSRLAPDSPMYHTVTTVPLPNDVDLSVLRRALATVISRHESLRTRYVVEDGEPRAVVDPVFDVRLEWDPDPGEFVRRPFDLEHAPPVRVCVLPRAGVALACVHHIATDGWSMRIFVRELSRLYAAGIRGERCRLPELPIRYADFATWQRTRLSGSNLVSLQEFWRAELAGLAPLDLVGDRPRGAAPTFLGDRVELRLDASDTAGLRALATGAGATMFMAALAIWALVLERGSGQDDFAVGTPVAGRSRVEFEPLIGLFVNTLVVRCDLRGDPTFRELLDRVKAAALRAVDHQDLPFQLLVEELAQTRDVTRSPIVQTMFRLETVARAGRGAAGGELTAADASRLRGTAELDLALDLWDDGTALFGHLEYSSELFDEATVRRFAVLFVRFTSAVVAEPDRPLSTVTGANADELARLASWQVTGPESAGRTVLDGIDAQAARTPDALAIAAVSYRELIERANGVAHRLKALGVRPGDVVACTAPRGAELVVDLLGIWKAGAGYLCLDPADPPTRRRRVLDLARPRLVLDAGFAIAEPASPTPPSVPPAASTADALAYVVFTSGTTGEPKGVRIGHRGLANHCRSFADLAGLAATDRVLQFAPPMFDVAAEEIFPTLLTGGRIVPVDAAPAYGLSEFARQVVREEISVVNLPAGYWHEWADAVVAGFATVPSTIRLVVVGSERLDPDRVARWQLEVGRHPVLLHAYGVSEATITSVVYRLDSGPVLLGRPLPGVDVAVTDRNGAVVPLGMPGELTLGGPGVALGYLDGSTASFCERDGQRWYRTGDRARWTPEGDLEFLGRLDRQLKIDGRRIEPAEIEAACMRDPRVVSAAVGLRNQRLIAVVTGTLDPDELLAGLRERLPPALVPAEAHVVPTLPRNAAGKVDVAALVRPAAGSTGPAPRTAGRLERQLREVWQEVLGVPDIGLDDSFFDVGGRSMSLVRAQSRLAGLGIEVAMIDLFRRPTIRTLAAHIAGRNQ